MHREETPSQLALRDELRRYYADLLTDDVRAELAANLEGGEVWRDVVARMGKDGWLGIGWPEEFGGQGRPATDQYIFFDETRRAGAQRGADTCSWSSPAPRRAVRSTSSGLFSS